MGMLKTQLKRVTRLFKQKVSFNSTIPVMPDSFISFLCIVTLACPIILPDHPRPPPEAASSSPPSPTSPLLKRSSADYRRIHPAASLEEDYFGYWNPEPFDGMEGPGPIPHVDDAILS